jgi:hypothetical protein
MSPVKAGKVDIEIGAEGVDMANSHLRDARWKE